MDFMEIVRSSAPPWCPGTLWRVRAKAIESSTGAAACRNRAMQLWFALASLASVSALNAGVRVQPHLPTTKIGRVVPARCVLAEPEEPGFSLKQFAIDAGITTMRLGTCTLMIHHGFDKVQVNSHWRMNCTESSDEPDRNRRLRRMWMASQRTSSPSFSASCRALLPFGPFLLPQPRFVARHFSPSASSPAQLLPACPQRWLQQDTHARRRPH